ncbi:HalOD1 output domain-containing protein [Haloferacaceae archaeon DSL9]
MTEKTNGRTTENTGSANIPEDQRTQVAQYHYDSDSTHELTSAIVYAIAEAEGVSPSEITSPPLYEYVDASAIEDAFFGPKVGGKSRRGTGAVEFYYDGYFVNVNSDGWIQVYEPLDPDGAESL